MFSDKIKIKLFVHGKRRQTRNSKCEDWGKHKYKMMNRLIHDLEDYASVNSSSAHPPPPRADPRELAFFENELANAPPPGQKSCSNAPG